MKGSTTIWLALMLIASAAPAADWVDVMCSYEAGKNPNTGFTNPQAVFVAATSSDDTDGLVSLGQWSQSALRRTPVGIVLGFSTSINNGDGNDLKIAGNAMACWWEPGYVEVARETSGDGATVDGWQDETWYLLKPSNYDQVGDPRDGALTINFSQEEFDEGRNPYTDTAWSTNQMTGYADVTVGGDLMDIDWAIDAAGNFVTLSDIAYVRIRTVTDSPAGDFGLFTTEIDYVEALNGYIPEPATLVLLALGGIGLMYRRRRK